MAMQRRLHDGRHRAALRNNRDARAGERTWIGGRKGQRDAVGVIDEAETVRALDGHVVLAGDCGDRDRARVQETRESRAPSLLVILHDVGHRHMPANVSAAKSRSSPRKRGPRAKGPGPGYLALDSRFRGNERIMLSTPSRRGSARI